MCAMSHILHFVIVITFVASYVVIGTVETPNTTGVNMIVRTAELVAVASIIVALRGIVVYVALPVLNGVQFSGAVLILARHASREEHNHDSAQDGASNHDCHLKNIKMGSKNGRL